MELSLLTSQLGNLKRAIFSAPDLLQPTIALSNLLTHIHSATQLTTVRGGIGLTSTRLGCGGVGGGVPLTVPPGIGTCLAPGLTP